LGIEFEELVFQREGHLVNDEHSLGELTLALHNRPSFIIGIGSGTLSDMIRYSAYITGVPFFLIPTAPSMDGYASSVAPLISGGGKVTFSAKAPLGIYADPSILRTAPLSMIEAGLGDLLGKLTAKADWLLSAALNGEPYCPVIQEKVDNAVSSCMNSLLESSLTDEKFLDQLTNGLILSGTAITMAGSSRPASGGEHHLAHYWEMQALKGNFPVGLHGQKVGLATKLILHVYEKVHTRLESSENKPWKQIFSKLNKELPTVGEYEDFLRKTGVSFEPKDLGLSRELVQSGLLEGMYIRERFTVLRFAHERGWLKDITAEIMEEI